MVDLYPFSHTPSLYRGGYPCFHTQIFPKLHSLQEQMDDGTSTLINNPWLMAPTDPLFGGNNYTIRYHDPVWVLR